jgi:triacylglycerol lipase
MLLACLAGCASVPRVQPSPERVPVLFVHGIDDNPSAFEAIRREFQREGWPAERLAVARLHPNNGQAPIEVLAWQVRRAAEGLRRRTGAERIDVVSFSLGALTTRYWLQALGGHAHVRRFVSLSGPHHGTYMAYTRNERALVQMRPGSDLLRDLNRPREKPFGNTEVFSFWTPLDGTIVPAESSRLPGATERTFLVPLHPMMLGDPSVLSAVREALTGPERE